jgi:hypothetical protein
MTTISRSTMIAATAEELAGMIMAGMDPSSLTFAAEILGRHDADAVFSKVLIDLLRHPSAVVREGAVYGLGCYRPTLELRVTLELTSTTDTSPGVRAAAQDMLDNWKALTR